LFYLCSKALKINPYPLKSSKAPVRFIHVIRNC
jgi:hypothetical protein